MKHIIIIFILIAGACGEEKGKSDAWDFNQELIVEFETEPTKKINEEVKPDETVPGEEVIVVEEPRECTEVIEGECQDLGAECCDRPGMFCKGGEHVTPTCMLPAYVRPHSVQIDTQDGVFRCLSVPDVEGKSLSIVGGYPDENGLRKLVITRVALSQSSLVGGEKEEIVNSAGHMTLVDGGAFEFHTFYEYLKAQAIPGFRGVYRGEFSSEISDQIWTVSCWLKNIEPTAIYNEGRNKCLDKTGQEAMNPTVGVAVVRGTQFAECMDFDGVALDEEVYDYHVLSGTNFRGSNLNGARLHFAHISNGDFRGASLESFEFGYANIDGKVNTHTKAPSACEVEEERIACSQ